MSLPTRRGFLRGAGAAAAAIPFARPALAAGRWSPNEEVRIAVIGLRGRGGNHYDGFARLPGVKVVALCDVDGDVLAQAAAKAAKHDNAVHTCRDVRELLERKDVDAIAVATPNHWHALMAVWACQAGKDVYLEKPVSHNVWEGAQIVAAARKYGRIVQAGTQSRSSLGIKEAIAWLHEGHLGKIRVARGLCYKPRQSIGKVAGPQQPPASVDYDLWCGPAAKVDLHRKNLHYDWHWDFNTGNGDLGNQGIHQMDIARWALGEPQLAPRVFSVGGRLGYDDDGNTPNTMVTWFDYANAPLVFEVRGLPRDKASQDKDWGKRMDEHFGAGIGVVVHCEGGHVRFPNYESAIAYDQAGKEVRKWRGADDHFANFIAAVRSRKASDLNGDIREGHVSSALCHMGNVSYLLGAARPTADALTTAAEFPAAAESLERLLAHLRANEVDLDATPLRVGRLLALDPQTERFAAADAQRLASRPYREGFVVPSEV